MSSDRVCSRPCSAWIWTSRTCSSGACQLPCARADSRRRAPGWRARADCRFSANCTRCAASVCACSVPAMGAASSVLYRSAGLTSASLTVPSTVCAWASQRAWACSWPSPVVPRSIRAPCSSQVCRPSKRRSALRARTGRACRSQGPGRRLCRSAWSCQPSPSGPACSVPFRSVRGPSGRNRAASTWRSCTCAASSGWGRQGCRVARMSAARPVSWLAAGVAVPAWAVISRRAASVARVPCTLALAVMSRNCLSCWGSGALTVPCSSACRAIGAAACRRRSAS